jgi:hypothetical protein
MRLVPKPRGNRPSIAALARSGERKASDIVMRIERSVFSRARRSTQWCGTDLWSVVEPVVSVAKRIDKNHARLGSHRPQCNELFAFPLMTSRRR